MTASFFNLNATFVVELAVFIIVLAVLGRFVIKPLQSAMGRRQAEIDDSLAKAGRVEEILAAAETDYQATLRQARQEARRIIETAQRMADNPPAARAHERPSPPRGGAPILPAAAARGGGRDLRTLGTVPNSELSSIELLDAAYSASRAAMVLEETIPSEGSGPTAAGRTTLVGAPRSGA